MMGLQCGIVGLPNVGKSTIFSALTKAPAESANYPFCTIDPNVGVVDVPDERLDQLSSIFNPQKTLPSCMEFLDIAGLVKGASKGEGLGNQFLGNIRQVEAICHIVRCFDDEDITHVHGKVDPAEDIQVIEYELALKDLETVEKRLETLAKSAKSHNKDLVKEALGLIPILEDVASALKEGVSVRTMDYDPDKLEMIKDLNLLTHKKQLFVCNVDEEGISQDNDYVKSVRELASQQNAEVILICGQIEKELVGLDSAEEQQEFMDDLGIKESGLNQLIKASYKLLGLETFFTAGEKEVRAWTILKGTKADVAAGKIHSDIQRGFIRAEAYLWSDIIKHKTEQKLKENGLLRVEGRDYIVQDGDVLHFRFNV